MQQKIGLPKFTHIIESNRITFKLLKLVPHIKFIKPRAIANIWLVSLSHAFDGGAEDIYCQTRTICRILSHSPSSDDLNFHPTVCSSYNQSQVSYSSFGPEILAAGDAEDKEFDITMFSDSIFTPSKMRHDVYVDARWLFDSTTTIYKPRDYLLQKTVARMCHSFEAGYPTGVSWVDGKDNLADFYRNGTLCWQSVWTRWCVQEYGTRRYMPNGASK